MQYKNHTGVILAIIVLFSVTLIPTNAVNIPPTRAFDKIVVNGYKIFAKSYSDQIVIRTVGDLEITTESNVITVKLKAKTCGVGAAFTRVDENGFLVCAVPSS